MSYQPIRRYVDGWIKDLYCFESKKNILPSYFEQTKYFCEFKFDKCRKQITKKIETTNSIGITYHENIDAVSMVKGWWIKN